MARIVTPWRLLFTDVTKDRSAACSESCLKMEAMRSLETSVGIYQSARRNMPESFNHSAAFSCDTTTANYNNLRDKCRKSVELGQCRESGKEE
jgi:hypothetical protein